MNLLSGHVYNVPLFEVLQKPLSPPSSLAVPSLPGKTPRLPILSPLCVDGVGGTSPKPTVTVHPVGPTSTTVFTAPSTSSTMRPMPPTPVFPAIGQTRLHELVASLLKISDEQKISEHFLDRDGYHRTKDLHVAAVPEIRGWNQLLHQIGLDSSVGLITNLLQMPAGRNVAMALIAIKLLGNSITSCSAQCLLGCVFAAAY
ncbi:hypothetical protein Pelo_425 [Pelomyxa schiedti]|nr:hypothetical protein Pelo_425 [Pelomyxa schiedti]